MTDKPKIPTWDEIYSNREPNDLEKRLAAQRQPGHIPDGWESWIVAGLTGERKQAAKRLALNGQLTREALSDLFK